MKPRAAGLVVAALALTLHAPDPAAAVVGGVPPGGSPAALEKAWQRWRSSEVSFYRIPERRRRRTVALLAHALNTSNAPRVNFIDVGCAVGDYLRLVRPRIEKELFSIGIDPIDWEKRFPYSVFLEVAIRSGPEGEAQFHLYGEKDLAASSLREMARANVTHDPKLGDTRFYVPFAVDAERGTRTVRTVPLSSVVETQGLADQVIHLLKIDAQGSDLDVFTSLGKYIPKVLFLQMETIYSDQEKHLLYEGQTRFSEELPVLAKHGFRLFNVAKFPEGPEADVVFVNEKLLDEMVPAR